MEFLNGDAVEGDGSGLRLYSFSKDANLIFAAFRQTHGIDLSTADLHWWEFLALFSDLGANTTFVSMISLRRRVKTGKASKEEIASARDIGDAFNLPKLETRTLEEKIAAEKFYAVARRKK